ncbi:geminin-like [Cydia amplana]|uniref:geminin-like n=1 Tax=Cydia amplana TaxID=1869771 RepID=UPI002FE5E2C1
MSESEESRPCQGLTALHNINRRTGGAAKSGKTKNNLLDYFHPRDSEHRKKVSKSTQVNSTWITEEDISSDVPSEHFWENVAEKRRVALEEALGENERLCKLYESLSIENDQYKTLLEEANSFVEVFKELVQDNADDTGIDVGDLSTSAETE